MDVKTNLKEANEAIKNKDYKTALKLCQAILKDDKLNYMALVFLGISLQEVGPVEKAPLAFKKAVQVNEANMLAWKGLINYYEKHADTKNTKELIAAYAAILQLESDETKIIETMRKLGQLSEERCFGVVEPIYRIALRGNLSQDVKMEACGIIVSYLNGISRIPQKLLIIYEQCIIELINNPKAVSKEFYSNYLNILYKKKKFVAVITEAEKMHSLYDNDVTSLEWICKIYNESYTEGNDLHEKLADKIANYSNKLLEISANSLIGLVTRAILLRLSNNFLEMRETLKQVTLLKPEHLQACILLTECCSKLHFYSEAVDSGRTAERLLDSRDDVGLHAQLHEYLCLSLCKSSERQVLEEAVTLCSKFLVIEVGNEVKYIQYLVEAYINLKNFVEAEMWLGKLKELNNDDDKISILKVKMIIARGNYPAALNSLGDFTVEDSEYWILTGKVYWALNECDKSLIPFLKATKLDPNSYECFLLLGNYYQKFDDLDKARRCYEKCFKINARCHEAGIELSKMYRKQQRWDENLNLLKSVTSGKIDVNMKWAYLELGIHYMEKEDFPEAINTLRFVVRIDSQNSHCWETLADAYMARGAYTSALKSYQRAFELRPDSLYSLYQIANIKKILGEYAEACKDFESILRLDKNYVLALKGLAETCLYLARQYHRQQLHGLARDYAQLAVDKATLGLREHSEVSCLWKIVADCCYLVAHLPERFCCLSVTAALAKGINEDRSVILDGNELYDLAARCYCKSISLIDDNVLIYHDLASCYLSQARAMHDDKVDHKLLEKAFSVVSYCTTNNPTHWQHWNLMGNVAYFQEPKNLALAQHAFIKAVTLERNSAVAWCNLGCIYMDQRDAKLANEAFSQAQRGDPNYVNSWVGQAMIAEAAGHEDAMDLFRHSTQLAPQQQGAIGYAHWVCRTLLESPLDTNVYSIHNMHAIPVACDALTWYTENNPTDPCAWNMLGMMREHMGLKRSAFQAFRKALAYSDSANRDCVNVNYGRLLRVLHKYPEAVGAFREVQEATFNSGSGLALALFKDEQYQESYEAYESALHWLTEEQKHQSDLLVALASMAYEFQGPDAAKTLLFQSTQLKPRSAWGLYATLSLGLLHKDFNLAALVLNELEELKDSMECLPHYGVLLSYTHLLQGDGNKAVRELSKLIHRHPDQASLWFTLSVLLLRLHKERKVTSTVAKCASVSMKLGRVKMDVTKVLCLVSLASLIAGNYDECLRAAQSAIHSYPDVAEGWCMLVCALKCTGRVENSRLSKMRHHMSETLEAPGPLKNWLENFQ